jgi:hypothetical protein
MANDEQDQTKTIINTLIKPNLSSKGTVTKELLATYHSLLACSPFTISKPPKYFSLVLKINGI